MAAKKYLKYSFKVIDRFIIYFILIHAPELQIGLADGSELNFDQCFQHFNVKKKYMRRVLIDLNLNAEY